MEKNDKLTELELIKKLSKIMKDIVDMSGNYVDRKVGRTRIGNVVVSTCYTKDMGYETALLDTNGVHPVERYEDEAHAVLGHAKWCEKVPDLNQVVKLGHPDLGAENETIIISNDPW